MRTKTFESLKRDHRSRERQSGGQVGEQVKHIESEDHTAGGESEDCGMNRYD